MMLRDDQRGLLLYLLRMERRRLDKGITRLREQFGASADVVNKQRKLALCTELEAAVRDRAWTPEP